MLFNALAALGHRGIKTTATFGRAGLMLFNAVVGKPEFRKHAPLLVRQLYNVGVLSMLIIIVSGLFIGMVLGLQGYLVLATYSAETSLGSVDAAYILATPEQIAYIKPMIAMRNGSQSNVTLYASSRSAQGTAGPDFRLEMEGLQYSEIPMLAGSNPSLMQQALSAVRNDYSLARLYAMGADAWSLANHFTQMSQTPGFELNGNTGDLTANQDCVINRKLSWLKYQQGKIVPAS